MLHLKDTFQKLIFLKGVLFCVVVEQYQSYFILKGEQRYGRFKHENHKWKRV